jgi:hypothetical protein
MPALRIAGLLLCIVYALGQESTQMHRKHIAMSFNETRAIRWLISDWASRFSSNIIGNSRQTSFEQH